MKSYSIILAVVALFSAAEACKCWGAQRHTPEYTHACCTFSGGIFSDDNCDGDIFDNLSTFSQCCENLNSTSDCSCPTCPEEDIRRKSLGLPPMTDAERVAFAQKSQKMEARHFIG
jgi:hypothetical protein